MRRPRAGGVRARAARRRQPARAAAGRPERRGRLHVQRCLPHRLRVRRAPARACPTAADPSYVWLRWFADGGHTTSFQPPTSAPRRCACMSDCGWFRVWLRRFAAVGHSARGCTPPVVNAVPTAPGAQVRGAAGRGDARQPVRGRGRGADRPGGAADGEPAVTRGRVRAGRQRCAPAGLPSPGAPSAAPCSAVLVGRLAASGSILVK
jgi:hypothetical protein